MNRIQAWLGVIRFPFLLLTLTSAALGLALALWLQGYLHPPHALLAVAGGLLAHTAVNVLNEYHDHASGLDQQTQPTPFSGGSGVLPAGLLPPRQVLLAGLTCLVLLLLLGCYFALVVGPAVLPLGLAGLVLICLYTPCFTRHPLSCLVAPGLGFGLIVTGVCLTQTGHYGLSMLAALVPGFLTSGLLLLNQLPDVAPDAAVGRRHYPMLWGPHRTTWLHAGLLLGAYLSLTAAVMLDLLPRQALLGLATLPLAARVLLTLAWARDRRSLVACLGLNVAVVLLTPLLMATGLVLAGLT